MWPAFPDNLEFFLQFWSFCLSIHHSLSFILVLSDLCYSLDKIKHINSHSLHKHFLVYCFVLTTIRLFYAMVQHQVNSRTVLYSHRVLWLFYAMVQHQVTSYFTRYTRVFSSTTSLPKCGFCEILPWHNCSLHFH